MLQKRKRQKWAFLIGIGDYQTNFPSLPFVSSYVNELYKILLYHEGYDEENIVVLSSEKEKNPRIPISFAQGFYRGLGFSHNIRGAVDFGNMQIRLNVKSKKEAKVISLKANPEEIYFHIKKLKEI